jgi:hypothetical protein
MALIARGTGEIFEIGTDPAGPPRNARGEFRKRGIPAEFFAGALTVIEFDPPTGAIPIHRGTGLAIKWSGEGGVRGSGAWHPTELVFDFDAATDSLILTGGNYKPDGKFTVDWMGRRCRRLPIFRSDGAVTFQIIGIW